MWRVEDGFFGALLGAGLGCPRPKGPPVGFILLVFLLSGVVVILNRVGETRDRWRQGVRAIGAISLTVLGWLLLCLVGACRWEDGLFVAVPVCAWVGVKFDFACREGDGVGR